VVRVCILDHDRYIGKFYDHESKVPISIFNGDFEINLAEAFTPLNEDEN